MGYSTLHLGDVHTNAKGAKMAPLTDGTDGGEQCFYTFTEATRRPFGPNNLNKDVAAPRQNLEICFSGDAAEYFRGLDAWAVDYNCAHNERLFKKQLTLQQTRDLYHPTIRQSPDYEPLQRAKINMPNTRTACRYWTASGESRDAPVHGREADVKPHVHISHLWLIGGSLGIDVNVCDLLVTEGSRAFPFARNECDYEYDCDGSAAQSGPRGRADRGRHYSWESEGKRRHPCFPGEAQGPFGEQLWGCVDTGRHWEQKAGEVLPAGGFMQQVALREGNVEHIKLRDGSKAVTRRWDAVTGDCEFNRLGKRYYTMLCRKFVVSVRVTVQGTRTDRGDILTRLTFPWRS
jgi:hypothetical protein